MISSNNWHGSASVLWLYIVPVLALTLSPQSQAQSVVDDCPATGTAFEWFYNECASSTEIATRSGLCTPSGQKRENEPVVVPSANLTFSDFAFCHECAPGRVISSDSTDTEAVCQDALSGQCNTGVNYEFTTYPCPGGDTNVVTVVCQDEIAKNLDQGYTASCKDNAYPTCENCDASLILCRATNDTETCSSLILADTFAPSQAPNQTLTPGPTPVQSDLPSATSRTNLALSTTGFWLVVLEFSVFHGLFL